MKNDIDQIVVILRKTRLNQLEKYEQNEYFFIKIYYIELIVNNWRN